MSGAAPPPAARSTSLDQLCINTVRTLAMDAVQQADSGHPGTAMALAPLAYVLWQRRLRYHPAHPDWFGRDRFVLSAGHACMLLYAVLYLTGYHLSLDDIKRFRQWGSRTPGHSEHWLTPGVEATTGPLGQGVGNAVGMALAEAHLAQLFNRPGHAIVDHCTYFLASDGDLMEGVSHEACSLAGHLKLGRLIGMYDDNRITIDGETDLTFSDDTAKRFESYGWHVERVADGNDLGALDAALAAARRVTDRPSLVIVRTHIAYGSPHKQDTPEAHGAPLGEDEVRLTRQYMRPPIRLAALSRLPVIYVFSHDSIGLGEDGPTHQPVEQLASLRALPDLVVLRPADATETVEAWRVAIRHQSGPVALVLTRQKVGVIDRARYGRSWSWCSVPTSG